MSTSAVEDGPDRRLRVLIAGGGVAGLEALLALRALAGKLVHIELIAPIDVFVYRPLLVAEPFGIGAATRVDLGPIVDEAGARQTRDALARVEPRDRTITTRTGTRLAYDALLVAAGARPVPALPGALTFGTEPERARFTELLGELGRRGTKRIAFVVPREATWSIAAYELALLTAAERDARHMSGVELTLVTHESAPLELFGAPATQLVAAQLEEGGITLRVSSVAERFEENELRLAEGDALSLDRVVALPALEVPNFPGLPQRERGFVVTDVHMHVSGLEDVWAAGDATSFPIKQGGLAAQQADVAARSIAARAGAHVPIQPFQPVLRGELITGGAPEFLRSRLREGSGEAAVGRALWWPPLKLAGNYLGPYLARTLAVDSSQELVDLAAPSDPRADEAEHAHAVRLLLAAADADAGLGDFERAIRWLSLVEQLNLVLPPEYVARRFEWQRELDPDIALDPAAGRIEPRFVSAEAAISDLQRSLRWLREIEGHDAAAMRSDLSHLERGIEHVIALSRRAGIYPNSEAPPARETPETHPAGK
jgi:sulfide:quinone oxidoreductase